MEFLGLVNDLIDESKITLDPLTALNFASPPRTVMYNRMKKWVRESYEEIVDERPEWYFTQERAVVTVGPRLHIAGVDPLVYTPAVGDVLVGKTSGISFTISAIFLDVEGTDTNAGTEYTIGVEWEDVSDISLILLNELVDVTQGPTTYVGAAYIEGRGRYSFEAMLPTLDVIDMTSVAIQPTVRGDNPNTNPSALTNAWPVNGVHWYAWNYPTNDFSASPSNPRYVIQMADGNYDFWPRPDGLYDVSFDYTQKCNVMYDPTDTPFLLPTKFHKLIVWRAMIKLADFEANQKMYATAKKGADAYYNRLLRDRLPKSMFNLSRFDRGYDNSY